MIEGSKEHVGDIYCLVNSVTSKVYVGSTIDGYKFRFKAHCRDANGGKNLPIYHAMRLYGVENFRSELLDQRAGSLKEIRDLEARYITKYNSLVPHGYNKDIPYDQENYVIPDATVLEMFDKHRQGLSHIEIAEIFSVHTNFVSQILLGQKRPHLRKLNESEKGDLPTDYRISISETVLIQCFELRAQGQTYTDISEKLNLNVGIIREVMTGGYRPEIKTMWEKVNTTLDLATISAQNVSEAMKDRKSEAVRDSLGKEFPSKRAAAEHYRTSPTYLGRIINTEKSLKDHPGITFTQITFSVEKKNEGACVGRQKAVVLSDGRVFPSVKDCADALGVTPDQVGRVLRGVRGHIKGFGVKEFNSRRSL